MSSLEWARYSNLRDESMGRSHQISDATIQKMEGFMQNPYSAEFPGIDVNQSGAAGRQPIMRSMPIPTGSIIISRPCYPPFS